MKLCFLGSESTTQQKREQNKVITGVPHLHICKQGPTHPGSELWVIGMKNVLCDNINKKKQEQDRLSRAARTFCFYFRGRHGLDTVPALQGTYEGTLIPRNSCLTRSVFVDAEQALLQHVSRAGPSRKISRCTKPSKSLLGRFVFVDAASW